MAIQPVGRVSSITGRGDSWDQFTDKINENFNELSVANAQIQPNVAAAIDAAASAGL